jgi:hypothetical protein
MTADAIYPPYAGPGSNVAVLPPGAPLPEPWYCDVHPTLECSLCGHAVDALWLLSPHRPADLGWGLSDGELCICRRCAEAIRPPATEHLSPHTTLAEQP